MELAPKEPSPRSLKSGCGHGSDLETFSEGAFLDESVSDLAGSSEEDDDDDEAEEEEDEASVFLFFLGFSPFLGE